MELNESLSIGEARGIALAAQGLDAPPPRRVEARHLQEAVRRMRLLQLDFVNVVVPAHYLVLYSRLGAYDLALFQQALYPDGFTEAWAHEASLVPMETWPLLHHRRASHRVRPWNFEKFLNEHGEFADYILARVREEGPLASEDIDTPSHVPGKIEDSWYGSTARAVLEAHFGRGALAVRSRRANFARVYDLAERLIPAPLLHDAVPERDACRRLLLQAAGALGVATAADLADYFRMKITPVKPLLEELVADGGLRRARVEGWAQPAYMAPGLAPCRHKPTSILSPFDPLIFYRPRTERLFGFDYKLEIFVPVEQRRWGYYVLPFLLEGELVARVDLKADRQQRALRVLSTHLEDGVDRGAVRAALREELDRLAAWLGLERKQKR